MVAFGEERPSAGTTQSDAIEADAPGARGSAQKRVYGLAVSIFEARSLPIVRKVPAPGRRARQGRSGGQRSPGSQLRVLAFHFVPSGQHKPRIDVRSDAVRPDECRYWSAPE